MKQIKYLTGMISLVVFCLLLLQPAGLVSCNTTGQDSTKLENAEIQKRTSAGQAEILSSPGKYSVLILKKSTLEDLFNPGGTYIKCKKIVFKFWFEDPSAANSGQSLAVYGVKDGTNQYIQDTPIEILDSIRSDLISPISLPGVALLGNIELTKKDYDNIKKNAGPSYQNATYIKFEPIHSPQYPHHVTYKVNAINYTPPGIQIQLFGEAIPLNPSPPAIPD